MCQVKSYANNEKGFRNFEFRFPETCRSFSGRLTVPFVRTWNRAQNWGRQTGPLTKSQSPN